MKWWKRLLGAGLVAGAAYAVWRALDEETRRSRIEWTPQPFLSPPMPVPMPADPAAPADPAPADPAPADPVTSDDPWVEPVDGTCPATHPVKGKLSSGIFHTTDGQLYERTVPDRCYRDPAAAEADGLRASKR